MDPIYAVIVIAVVGLLCWAVVTFIPMPDPFPRIIIAVAVIFTILWLLAGFGIFSLSNHRGP
jgi:hypothetical protein